MGVDEQVTQSEQWDAHRIFQRLHTQYFARVNSPRKSHAPTPSSGASNTPCRLWESLMPFPVVHAGEITAPAPSFQDNLMESASQKSMGTSMDKLCESRPTAVVTDAEIKAHIAKETGKERVMLLFTKMNNGHPHPHMELIQMSIFQCSTLVFFVAAYFGGMEGKERFVAKNKHSKFDTKFQATRKYNDAILLSGMKNGMVYAFKTGLFTGTFLTTAFSVAMYRNQTSPLDFIAAGAVTGGLFRLSMGLRGLFAGSVIGSVMGGVAGTVMWFALWASDETQDKKHYWFTEAKLREKKEIAMLNAETVDHVSSTRPVLTTH